MTIEKWKTIKNPYPIESRIEYQASNFGRIRSLDGQMLGKTKNGSSLWRKKKGQIVKGNLNKNRGYWTTFVYGKKRCTHRWIAETWLDKVSGKDLVNHKDGNRLNNNVDNLEWCTNTENIRHGHAMGSYKSLYKRQSSAYKNEGNPNSKLKQYQVDEIRKLLKEKKSYREISLIYKVSGSCIYFISSGKSWKK